MASLNSPLVIAAAAALALVAFAGPAAAKCTRLASSVNDYGKDGPTRDAQVLLDKNIADTMAKRGIKKYTTGKKDVTCELFLDFGVFDEHTCKAAATVCWTDSPGAAPKEAAAPAADAPAKAPAKKAPAKAPAPAKAKAAEKAA